MRKLQVQVVQLSKDLQDAKAAQKDLTENKASKIEQAVENFKKDVEQDVSKLKKDIEQAVDKLQKYVEESDAMKTENTTETSKKTNKKILKPMPRLLGRRLIDN